MTEDEWITAVNEAGDVFTLIDAVLWWSDSGRFPNIYPQTTRLYELISDYPGLAPTEQSATLFQQRTEAIRTETRRLAGWLDTLP